MSDYYYYWNSMQFRMLIIFREFIEVVGSLWWCCRICGVCPVFGSFRIRIRAFLGNGLSSIWRLLASGFRNVNRLLLVFYVIVKLEEGISFISMFLWDLPSIWHINSWPGSESDSNDDWENRCSYTAIYLFFDEVTTWSITSDLKFSWIWI